MIQTLRHELRLFFVALQFLTRVPVPAWVGWQAHWLNQSVRHFSLVGAGIGAFGALLAWAASSVWPPVVAAAVSVAGTLWLTVAFHEDGLADSADALLGAAPRERALAIMKDSRIGSYGASALALSLLLRVLLLAELLHTSLLAAAAACVAAHACGRAASVLLMAVLPYAGDAEQAKAKPLARAVRPRDAAWALAWAVAPVAAAAACNPAPKVALGAAGLGLALLLLLMRRGLMRRLGGYTGDTLGACEQCAEIAVLAALAGTWPTPWL